jgi:GDP-L-fucose synthase
VLDVSRLAATGWSPRIGLDDGIATTYQWFCDQQDQLRGVHSATA